MYENQEQAIEQLEKDTEITECEEELDERKDLKLKKAIILLENDEILKKILEEEKYNLEVKKNEIEEKKNTFLLKIATVEDELNLCMYEINEVEKYLSKINPNDTEISNIVNQRKLVLDECILRLNCLKDRLSGRVEQNTINFEYHYTEEEYSILTEIDKEENYDIESKLLSERKVIEPRDSGRLIAKQDGLKMFIPNSEKALEKMYEYGRVFIEYKNGYPDFSPFVKHNSEWGLLHCEVIIPNMTDRRLDKKNMYGKRRTKKEMVDISSGIGNYTQADLALVDQIIENNPLMKCQEKIVMNILN